MLLIKSLFSQVVFGAYVSRHCSKIQVSSYILNSFLIFHKQRKTLLDISKLAFLPISFLPIPSQKPKADITFSFQCLEPVSHFAVSIHWQLPRQGILASNPVALCVYNKNICDRHYSFHFPFYYCHSLSLLSILFATWKTVTVFPLILIFL